jgi:hypothetical protein
VPSLLALLWRSSVFLLDWKLPRLCANLVQQMVRLRGGVLTDVLPFLVVSSRPLWTLDLIETELLGYSTACVGEPDGMVPGVPGVSQVLCRRPFAQNISAKIAPTGGGVTPGLAVPRPKSFANAQQRTE